MNTILNNPLFDEGHRIRFDHINGLIDQLDRSSSTHHSHTAVLELDLTVAVEAGLILGETQGVEETASLNIIT